MLNIETIVFSKIKAILNPKLKTKYSKISFTTSDKVSSEPDFPNVYVHMMNSPETGDNLEDTLINGIIATFQIETNDNQSQGRAKDVMNEVVQVMKGMHFTMTMSPEFSNTKNTYRCIARFRRTIGSSDTL